MTMGSRPVFELYMNDMPTWRRAASTNTPVMPAACRPSPSVRTPAGEYTAQSIPRAASVAARDAATTPSSPMSTRHVVLAAPGPFASQQTPHDPGSVSVSASDQTTDTGPGPASPESTAMPKLPATATSPPAFARTWSTRPPSLTTRVTVGAVPSGAVMSRLRRTRVPLESAVALRRGCGVMPG